MNSNKEDPPSYKEAVSDYVPPPIYREREVTTANDRSNSTASNEDDQMTEMLNNVTESTEFGSIDNFDFQQLDNVLNGVDLTSNVTS